jgi:hypothetical protein
MLFLDRKEVGHHASVVCACGLIRMSLAWPLLNKYSLGYVKGGDSQHEMILAHTVALNMALYCNMQ